MNPLSLLAELIAAVFRALIEVPVIWVGEIVLFLVTMGRHKPRWDVYMDTGGSDFAFFSEMSFWVGVVALCGVGGAIKLIFFSP